MAHNQAGFRPALEHQQLVAQKRCLLTNILLSFPSHCLYVS